MTQGMGLDIKRSQDQGVGIGPLLSFGKDSASRSTASIVQNGSNFRLRCATLGYTGKARSHQEWTGCCPACASASKGAICLFQLLHQPTPHLLADNHFSHPSSTIQHTNPCLHLRAKDRTKSPVLLAASALLRRFFRRYLTARFASVEPHSRFFVWTTPLPMQFDDKSCALVKKSTITLAIVSTLVALYERSLLVLAFGLLTIAFVPLSVWALEFFPTYVWFGLLVVLQPMPYKPPAHALIAPAGH